MLPICFFLDELWSILTPLMRDGYCFQAWQSKGVSIDGSQLTCEGSEFCTTCKDDPVDFHGARYLVPFTPEFPQFEVSAAEHDTVVFIVNVMFDLKLLVSYTSFISVKS